MDTPSTEHNRYHFPARMSSKTIVVLRGDFYWNINVFRAEMNTPYSGSNDRTPRIGYLPKSSVAHQLSGKVSIHASVFFSLKTKRAASIPVTCLRLLHSPYVAVVADTRKLNDNFDCNQDKYFSFEAWYDMVRNDGL